jgi:hypothetical protein
MGITQGLDLPGHQTSFDFAGGGDNRESPDQGESPVGEGANTPPFAAPIEAGHGRRRERARKHPLPEPGTVVGELRVVRHVVGHRNAIYIELQCSCGSAPYSINPSWFARRKHNCCRECWQKMPTDQRNKPENDRRGRDRTRKHPLPEPGTIVGELRVLRHVVGHANAIFLELQCSCGGEPYLLNPSSFANHKNYCCRECWRKLPLHQRHKPENDKRGQNNNSLSTRFARDLPIPEVGQVYGKSTVTKVLRGIGGGVKEVWAQCACGVAPRKVASSNLLRGKADTCRRCGQIQAGLTRKLRSGAMAVLADNAHRYRLQRRINSAIYRCTNPKCKAYADYGGRGITVHAPWIEDRVAFLRYLVTLPGWDNPELELDRRDNNGNYEPRNLRFITRKQNIGNRRNVTSQQVKINDQQAEIDQLKALLQAATGGAV